MNGSARTRALVIGAAGQDGSYLVESLVERGYEVLAVVRRDPSSEIPNLEQVRPRIEIRQADLMDITTLASALSEFQPHEVYNFASVSFGPDAWTDPRRTVELGTIALTALLEELRTNHPETRFFQASSSWVFGRPATSPQDESTKYAPAEPYGAAKAFGNHLIAAYRDHYGIFACSGILFNHESPRRGEQFVTRKITSTAARIKLGLTDELVLGDVSAKRDWSYAGDIVEAIWKMLQQNEPDDYVLASGVLHSVEQFAETAFARLGLDWRDHVRFDDSLRRSGGQVVDLVGDASKARTRLGWQPEVSFEQLVELMVDSDLAALRSSD